MTETEYPIIKSAVQSLINDLSIHLEDPFETRVVVCHNTKVIQWLKSYYLKNNQKVLMNIKFQTLSSFVNELMKDSGDEVILSRQELRDYIIEELLDCTKYSYDVLNPKNPINYIFNSDGTYKGDCLYDFADTLSSLFVNYEFDMEDMDSWEGDPEKEWEKKIYDSVIQKIQINGCFTPKSLYEKNKGMDYSEKIRTPVYVFNNSYLTNLYRDILGKCDNVSVYSLKPEALPPYFTDLHIVFKAPSVVREVEEVHSRICQSVMSKVNIKYNDFVVYAPNIDDYADTINQVFKQDDSHFPAVPYRIVGSHRELRDMASSFALLREMAGKGFFTRFDLQSFLKNPMIQRVHDISDAEAQSFMDAVLATNAYRNGKDQDDWDYLKKRLLLSQLVSGESSLKNKTKIGAESFLPYSSIDMDAASANKLIDLLDALSSWTQAFPKDITSGMLYSYDFDRMTGILDAIYSRKSVDGDELNRCYAHVYDENEKIKGMGHPIPAGTYLSMLSEAIQSFVTHPADMFTAGVTFLSLDADNMVYEPYTFVMGASSANLPRKDTVSEIDYGKNHLSGGDLDKMSMEAIYSGAHGITLSYVFRDLKKDCEFYPSPLLLKPADYKVPLDETRDYDRLFTKKEFVNRKYYDGLLNSAAPVLKTTGARAGVEESLSITDFKHFFSCSFGYKFNRLCDMTDEEEKDEYEPLTADYLKQYAIVKDIIKNPSSNEKEICTLKRNIPEGALGDLAFEACSDASLGTQNTISSGYSLMTLSPLTLKTKTGKWTLNCNVDMYVKEEENRIFCLEPVAVKTEKKIKPKDYLNSYIFSLMYLSGKTQEEKTYMVTLREMDESRSFEATPQKAEETLNAIYGEMVNYSDLSYLDDTLLKSFVYERTKYEKDMEKDTFKIEYFNNPEKYNEWNYFKNRNMIDTDQEISVQGITKYMKKMTQLLLFL